MYIYLCSSTGLFSHTLPPISAFQFRPSQTILACVLSDPHRPYSPVYFQTVPSRLWSGPLWQTILACVLSDPHRPHSPVYFQTVPTRLWSGPLWQTILACALQPLVVGFDMAHVEVMQKLPEEVGKWFCVENT